MVMDTWQRMGRRGIKSALAAVAGIGLLVAGSPAISAQQSGDEVTFTKDVARILQENCQSCHRDEGIGPMSLISYDQVRPWAPLIRDRVVNRIMPPWPIDKTIGIQDILNDQSLTDDEIRTIARWVDSGAPEGDPADMPALVEWPDYSDSWRYEEVFGRPPDVVIRSPSYMVQPTGMDQWPNLQGEWEGVETFRMAKAIEARPGNPETRYVFHHGGPTVIGDNGQTTGLMNSPSGKIGEIWPEDAGKPIYPGNQVRFGMHYFPIGDEVDAVMEWGLWLYPEGEEPEFRTGEVQFRADQSTGAGGFMGHSSEIARRGDLLIPPYGQAMYRGVYVLDKPARIHSVRGHMHTRGKYQMLEAIYPDGRQETIVKLDWDHGWHTAFMYEEHARPLLPAGTVIITTSIYDNTDHRYNHGPEQWVTAGSRTIDEMSHIWVGITYFDGAEDYFEQLVAEREALLAERERQERQQQTADADSDR